MLSRRQCYGRVAAVERLDSNTVVLSIKANPLWQGNKPGQYVELGVVIDGQRLQRYYSPLTSGQEKIIQIGVSRHQQGIVSNYLVDNCTEGEIVTLSHCGGFFTLPETLPSKIRLLSAGSGFTAIVALLRSLVTSQYSGEVLVVHYGPTIESVPCLPLFMELVGALKKGSFYLGLTQTPQSQEQEHPQLEALRKNPRYRILWGRITQEHCHPYDDPTIPTYACGPQGFIQEVRCLTEEKSFHAETFTPVLAAVPNVKSGTTVPVNCAKSGKIIQADCGRPLLETLLEHKIKATYGCKMGVCFNCATMKTSGIVRNALTNARNEEPDCSIQTCISLPESEIELQL